MEELTTTATLVEYGTFEDESAIGAVLVRSELEAALHADESVQLWFELGLEEDEETTRLTLELTDADLEEMLRLSTGDEITLAIDGDAVAGLFGDPDVEAHGMRGALAVAVAGAAIAAPTSLAAAPQTASAAATAQRAGAAATAQTAGLAATTQVSSLAARAQVARIAARTQISKSLVVKAGGVTLLRGGLAR